MCTVGHQSIVRTIITDVLWWWIISIDVADAAIVLTTFVVVTGVLRGTWLCARLTGFRQSATFRKTV